MYGVIAMEATNMNMLEILHWVGVSCVFDGNPGITFLIKAPTAPRYPPPR